jgi:hypothetical protein
MKERPDAPKAPEKVEPDGKAGENFCQLCGGKTKFAGGMDYDAEDFICQECGALHVMRLTYKNGKVISSVLETVY